MLVRLATTDDIPQILDLYDEAHEVMRRSGNPTQWPDDYPGMMDVTEDLSRDRLYVAEKDAQVAAVFYFAPGPDPTYAQIDGAWPNDEPYHVVHRIASIPGSGAGRHCLAWACAHAQNLRIDTHRDNAPMRHVLRQLGFVYCGTIICEDGTPRRAYIHAA